MDGQQRLTLLTLLLIFFNHLQSEVELDSDPVALDDYISLETRGQRAFNMQVLECKDVIEALYNGRSFDRANQPESFKTSSIAIKILLICCRMTCKMARSCTLSTGCCITLTLLKLWPTPMKRRILFLSTPLWVKGFRVRENGFLHYYVPVSL